MAQVQQVAPPRRQPRKGTLKRLLGGSFVREQRLAAVTAVVWEDSSCGWYSFTRAGCYDTVVADAPKSAIGISQFEGIAPPFAVYRGVECYLGGDNGGATYREQALAALEVDEELAVEAKLAEWAFADAAGTTRATLLDAVALIEENASEEYNGLPLLIVSRSLAVFGAAEQVFFREDGGLVTANGTPVLTTSGVGFSDLNSVVAAIGWPEVYASDPIAYQADDLPQNMSMAIAERVYAIGVDCEYRFAVTIDPTP